MTDDKKSHIGDTDSRSKLPSLHSVMVPRVIPFVLVNVPAMYQHVSNTSCRT